MYNLNRVKNEFYEACKSQGMELELPIYLNGRLTRTLGRVTMVRKAGKVSLKDVEFSKQLIETASDSCIRDVILHEAAHAIATYKSGENHGHDEYFKSICHKLGTTNDGVATEVERTVEVKDKYEVFCPTCGKIGGYSRMCNTIKYISDCSCGKCGNNNLTYRKNW